MRIRTRKRRGNEHGGCGRGKMNVYKENECCKSQSDGKQAEIQRSKDEKGR